MPRPKPLKPRHSVNLRLDLDTYTRLKAYAESRDRSITWLINQLLARAAEHLLEMIDEKHPHV